MSHLPSLSESARQLGKHCDFFVHVKRNTPKLYRLMGIYGKGNFRDGASLYFKATYNLREGLAQMYYELSECNSVTRFFRETKKVNPYKNSNSLSSSIKSNAFLVTDRSMRFSGYVSGKKLLKIYDDWKEHGFNAKQKETIRRIYE